MIRFFPARPCRISLTFLVVSFKIIGTKKARALHLGGSCALASLATPLTRSLQMPSLPQAPTTREPLTELIAELYGDQPASLSPAGSRWQQAVAQVDAQLHTKLRVE